jgi:zinc transporter ZupT
MDRLSLSGAPVAVATALAWAGALVATLLRGAGSRVMQPLVYAALFFFGASAIFDILPSSKAALDWPTFVAAAGGGYVIFWTIGRYVAPICPACAMHSIERDHHHAHGTGLVLLGIVLGVHCFLDGLGISAASSVNAAFGLRVFGAIAVHKIPEGFALAVMLMIGTGSPVRAFVWAVAIEAVTLAGMAAGSQWIQLSGFWLAVLLAHIGGTFLYLSVTGLRDALSPRLTASYENRRRRASA